MRRSNSLLNNLAGNMPAQPGAYHPQQGPYAGHQSGHVHPAYYDTPAQMAQPAGYGYPQAQVIPPQMPATQHVYAPAVAPQFMPQTVTENGPGMHELQTAQANLDALVGRLGEITASHEARLRDTSSTEALAANVQRLSQAVVEMQSGISVLHNLSEKSDKIPEIKSLIDGLQQNVATSLSSIPEAQIDPAAYAKVVEASHSEVLNEVRNIHSALERTNSDGASLTQLFGSHREDVLQRLEMMSGRLGEMDRSEDRAELFALRQQMENLDSLIRENASKPEVQLDEESINERLEEITRAILALSGTDSGVDNLERLEARVIELSKNLNTNPGASQIDAETLEAFFGDTRTALKALDDRVSEIASQEAVAGSNDLLLEQVRELSNRVSKLSTVEEMASFASGSEDPALISRLDQVVDRIAGLQDSGSGMDERFDQLLEKLNTISDQMHEAPKGKKSKSKSGSGSIRDKAIIEKLDQVLNTVSALDPLSEATNTGENVAALTQQLEGISSALTNLESPENALKPIENRLESIEQQLGASRDIGIELASGAAEDAVRRVFAENPVANSIDTDTLQGLWDDIRKLNVSNESDSPEADADVAFVKESLQNIAMRLGALETNIGLLRDQKSAVVPPATAPLADFNEPASPRAEALEPASAAQVEHSIPVMEEPVAMAAPVYGDPSAMVETPLAPEQGLAEPAPESSAEKEMSAGEYLVKAARKAEQERQLAKQGEEERYASETKIPDANELDANLPTTVPELASVDEMPLPRVNSPTMDFEGTDAGLNVPTEQATESNPDMPLEPGSGGPDLAALVRQANERRKSLVESGEEASGTDFLAAARRAAQAAAKEASEDEAVSSESEVSSGLLNKFTNLLSGGRKKNLLIAGLAILGVAVAVPVMSQFAFGDKNPRFSSLETASIDANGVVASEGEEATGLAANTVETGGLDGQDSFGSENDSSSLEAEISTVSLSQGGEPTLPFDHAEVQAFPADLRDAALYSDPLAIFEVARRYTSGIGVERDLETASRYYAHAAEAGFVPAQYFIGNFYEKGIGVELDRTVAQAWYEQAAYGGHVVAMHNLGVMFAASDPATGKADFSKAFSWFEKAAAHGVRDSQVNLGIFHAKGMAGEIDLIESYKWLALAARSGDKDALEKRELIADAMRPDQLDEAKLLVEEWRELEVDQAVNNVEIPASWQDGVGVARVLDDAESIAQAQILLGKVGFDAGPADGVIGKKTRTAIRNFRSRTGLPVTDKLDTQVMEALRAVAI